MSGGYFNYAQNNITNIICKLEEALEQQGKEIPKEERWMPEDYYKKYPEEKHYPVYSEKLQQEFKKGLLCLKKAKIYAQRIDWFLSSDDSEETFYQRLHEELKQFGNDTQ